MHVVTLTRLNRALGDAIRDFEHLGLWTEALYRVDVFLVPAGHAYGWKWGGADGHIAIPVISLSRLSAAMGFGQGCGLRDILRHEYGHAVADVYPKLSRSKAFRQAFGASYDRGERIAPYNPEQHVTRYASTEPAEDFCEVFMYYVKHRGRLPARFDTPVIRRKWAYVEQLVRTIRAGRRTF
ncbi:MAG: hypothetical protein ACPGUC_09700 [Gammaproteobacteria bacterium]